MTASLSVCVLEMTAGMLMGRCAVWANRHDSFGSGGDSGCESLCFVYSGREGIVGGDCSVSLRVALFCGDW